MLISDFTNQNCVKFGINTDNADPCIYFFLQQALSEREQLQQQNYGLQHKLAEYFRKKKSDDARQDIDKNVTDHDQRYLKYMGN